MRVACASQSNLHFVLCNRFLSCSTMVLAFLDRTLRSRLPSGTHGSQPGCKNSAHTRSSCSQFAHNPSFCDPTWHGEGGGMVSAKQKLSKSRVMYGEPHQKSGVQGNTYVASHSSSSFVHSFMHSQKGSSAFCVSASQYTQPPPSCTPHLRSGNTPRTTYMHVSRHTSNATTPQISEERHVADARA